VAPDAIRGSTVRGRAVKPRYAERFGWGLLTVVAVAVCQSWPDLDLPLSRAFWSAGRFVADGIDAATAVYLAIPWVARALFFAALVVACGWRWTGAVNRAQRRAALGFVLIGVLGVGLAVDAGLKTHWGRARPYQLSEFGGTAPYSAPLERAHECERNCSFVSGHAASGFSLMAFGILAAPRRRRTWWLAGLAAGSVIGLLRVAQGRHFASDILFALVVIWGVQLLVRELWVRTAAWRRARRLQTSSISASIGKWSL
jgi:membrane-associated PAP2 superfamily phosphatase